MHNIGRMASCQLSCGSGRLLLPSRIVGTTPPCKPQQTFTFPSRLHGHCGHHSRARLCCAAYKGKAGSGTSSRALRRCTPHSSRGSVAEEEGQCLLLVQHLIALGSGEEQGARVAEAMDAAEVCEAGASCLMETLAERQAGLCCKEVLHWLERRQLAQPAHYTLAIGALGAAGRWEAAEAVFVGMERAGVRCNHFHFAALVEALRTGRQWHRVLEVFKRMQQGRVLRSTQVCNSALLACEKLERWPKAYRVLQDMKRTGVRKNAFTFAKGVAAMHKARRWGTVQELYLEMQACKGRKCTDPVLYTTAMTAVTRLPHAQRLCSVQGVLRDMKAAGAQPDAHAYTAAISASDNFEAAAALLEEMRAEGGRPTTSVYNAVLKMCKNQPGGWWRAEELMRNMRAEGVRADARSWNSLLAAAAGEAAPAQLIGLMEHMLTHKIRPDVVTFSVVLSACARHGDAPTALALVAQMKEGGVRMDVVACTALMAVHESVGNSAAALTLLRSMEEAGLLPNLFTYLHAIGSCKLRGEWQVALGMLDDACSRPSLFRRPASRTGADLRSVVFTAVVQQLVDAGQEEQAVAQYHRMRGMGVPVLPGTLTALMKPLADRGEWRAAHQLRVSMAQQGLVLDQAGQELLVKASCPLMERSMAREALDMVAGSGLVLDLDLYITLVQVCERMHLPVQAAQVYAFLRESGIVPDTCTYEAVLRAVSGGTEPASAAVVERVLSDMHEQEARAPAAAYSALVKASRASQQQARDGGNHNTHQFVVQRLEDAGQLQRCSDFNQLLEASMKREDVYNFETVTEDALHVLDRMKEKGLLPNGETYSTLIQVFSLDASGCRQAEQFASEMLAHDWRPSTYTMNCLLNCFKENGHCAGALRWFHMLTDQGVAPDEYTFSILISACEDDWVRARDVFGQMKEFRVQPDTVTYTALLATLKTSGQWRTALKVYEDMKTAGLQPSHVTYNILAEVLNVAAHDVLEAAKTVYLEMCQTDGLIEAQTFALYASLFERQGEVDMVRRVHADMKIRDVLGEQGTFDLLPHMYENSKSRKFLHNRNECPQTASVMDECPPAASTTMSNDYEDPLNRTIDAHVSETTVSRTSAEDLLQTGQRRPYVSANPEASRKNAQVDVFARLGPGSSCR